MTDIFSLKVEEIVSKIKDAQLTSVEVCQKYIDRINKFEKEVKAWVHFDKKLLLEKAKEADEYRRSGKPTGPLHGIPIALKDIIGTIDMPTECGTPIRKGKSYSQNAEIVDLLLSAGAIVMGKTATSELAYLGPSKTTNPHDHLRTPGGSSSGSAASVASFMAPLSIGSQTGGSVIRPASYCGVVGYKPTYGLISRNGVLKTSEKLDHIGVFGRSVEDVAFIAAMQNDSPIKNKVGTAPLPGADKVWNRVSNKWENQYNQAPYIVWGWAVGVAKKSKVQEMAFDYLCFFSNGANHQADLAIGNFGVNPFKNSDFDPQLYINTMGWDADIANSYTKTLKDMEKSKNRVFPLRVRGVFEFTSAVATGTSKALAGQLSPQEALDEVAKEWEAIVSRVGKKNVQEDYAVGVKMEDNKL
ncbi:amidase family protein [bacterium]|nr:amidase family protein [bacterium]